MWLNGDELAMQLLVTELADRLHQTLRLFVRSPSSIDDVIQETLTRLVFLVHRRAPVLHRRNFNLLAYLVRVAFNVYFDAGRRKQARPLEDLGGLVPDCQPGPADQVESADTEAIVRREIDRLPPTIREAICLRFYDELTLKEIAKRQHTTIATAYRRVGRGLDLLRDRFSQLGLAV